ncbi:unnamed protein product, partial [Musa textilis]
GRGRRAINKARGLGPRPPSHMGGVLVYHLPEWESGRHNLWQRGNAFARPYSKMIRSQAANLAALSSKLFFYLSGR